MTKGVYSVEETTCLVSILSGFNLVQVTTLICSSPRFIFKGEIMAGLVFGVGIPFIFYGNLLGYAKGVNLSTF